MHHSLDLFCLLGKVCVFTRAVPSIRHAHLDPAGPQITDLDDFLQLPVIIHHKDVYLRAFSDDLAGFGGAGGQDANREASRSRTQEVKTHQQIAGLPRGQLCQRRDSPSGRALSVADSPNTHSMPCLKVGLRDSLGVSPALQSFPNGLDK